MVALRPSPPGGMASLMATVARSTPGWSPRIIVEAARMAPVFPAYTNASDLPAFWISMRVMRFVSRLTAT